VAFYLGTVHKRRPYKIKKNLIPSSLVRKCPHWLNSPSLLVRADTPYCPCGHTLNFEKYVVFCTKKCRPPHLKNPPCPQNVCTGHPPDCGRLLWTAPYRAS